MEHAGKMQKGQLTQDGQFDRDMHNDIDRRVAILINQMSNDVTDECRRVGAWGILGEGTGGQIVQPGTRTALARTDLISELSWRYLTFTFKFVFYSQTFH